MAFRGLDHFSHTRPQPGRDRVVPDGGSHWPIWATLQLVAALLAVMSGLPCWGRGALSEPQLVQLSVQVSPGSLVFGNQPTRTTSPAQTVAVTNAGTGTLTISAVTIDGLNASDFARTADTCTGAAITPNSACAVSMAFTPSATGNRSARLNFASKAGAITQAVNLAGLGAGPLAGVFTQRYDNGRTGANTHEELLAPSDVTVDRFGKLFSLPVDGQVYAQPLYVAGVLMPNQGAHNVVYVATQHDGVYAFDADGPATAPLWYVSFVNPAAGVTTVPPQDVFPAGAFDIKPEIGITSTPVIDPASGTLYVTAKTRELQDSSCTLNCKHNYVYRLHALDIATGGEKFGGPVVIRASVPGNGYDSVGGMVTFGGLRQLQRPGLLLVNGTVYLGFGSQGDMDPYHGWLLAYDASTLRRIGAFNVTPNGNEGSIWQGGGGIAADGDGNLYVVTANGTFDANKGRTDYGDSVLKLRFQSGQFYVLDYFTPANQDALENYDWDLGSGPPLILPEQLGPHPHLLATAGKDSRLYLLDRDNLGHQQRGDAGALHVESLLGMPFAGGAYWNGNLYLQAVGDSLRQFPLADGKLQSPTTATFQTGFPNPALAISAHGTSDAILWLVQTDAFPSGGLAVLRAFDATDVRKELYNSSQASNHRDQAGPAVKFVVPTVFNGKVYVGTTGEVDVYGLLP